MKTNNRQSQSYSLRHNPRTGFRADGKQFPHENLEDITEYVAEDGDGETPIREQEILFGDAIGNGANWIHGRMYD